MKILLLLLWMAPAHALIPLTAQTSGDAPRSLPQGRFMVSYHREIVPIGSYYNNTNGRQPYSDQFNRSLTWNQIAEADVARTEQLKGMLAANGIEGSELAANYVGDIAGKIDVTVPVIGYGITDSIGLFVAIPIVHFEARSTLQYLSTSASRAFVSALGASEQKNVADEFALTLNEGVRERLGDAGYDYQDHVDRQMVGDIQVLVPILMDRTFAIYPTLILPTGQAETPSDLFGVGSGEGRLGLGARAVKTWAEPGRFSFTSSGGTRVLLPRTQAMRIPRYEGDALSTDIDSSTQLGLAFGYSLLSDVRYQISRSWVAQLGVQHQQRFAESVSGSQVAQERYSLLERDRSQRLESLFVNFELNTIRAFLDQDFLFPMQWMIGGALPFSGKNTVASASGMMQVSLFF